MSYFSNAFLGARVYGDHSQLDIDYFCKMRQIVPMEQQRGNLYLSRGLFLSFLSYSFLYVQFTAGRVAFLLISMHIILIWSSIDILFNAIDRVCL